MVYTIIQARMNSSRLPGKVLMDLLGIPELIHVVRRVKQAKKVDKVIVATTDTKADDSIEEHCIRNDITCFRGSENDVLDRFYKAAISMNAQKYDYIVRVTADCPFIDANVIDTVIDVAIKNNVDYASNTITPTYPDGLDVEVFTFEALEYAWKNALLNSEREHVTPYLYKNADLFSIQNVEADKNYSDLRWTLDEIDDFIVINNVYEELYNQNNYFSMSDIVTLLKQKPKIFQANAKYKRNEGYEMSLKKD